MSERSSEKGEDASSITSASSTFEPDEKEDQILSLIGNFGRWQAIIISGIITFFVVAVNTWQALVMTFHAPGIDFLCKPVVVGENDTLYEDYTYQQWQDIAHHLNEEDAETCDVMYYNPGVSLAVRNESEKCQEWIYDYSFYPRTIVSDFDFVCDRRYLVSLSQSMYEFGNAFGVIISGPLADRFGRKWTFLGFAIIALGICPSVAAAPTDYAYIILRFFAGMFMNGPYTVIYSYGMEHVGGKWKVIYGIGYQLPWSVAYCALPGIAYALPDWRLLQLSISIPIIIYIPIALSMYESPKWLLSKDKNEKAEKIVKKIVKFNKRNNNAENEIQLEKELYMNADLDGNEKSNYFDLFKTRNLRKMTLIQYFIWFGTSCIYYGLTINVGTLVPNASLYINFLIGGLVEIPSYFVAIIVILYSGRRLPLAGTYFLGGVSLFLMLTVLDSNAGSLAFSNIGKFGLTASFAIIYLYAAEIFPTVLRATGIGSSSMFARFGSILAPFIGGYLGEINRVIPIITFGVLALVAGMMTLLLPETGGKKLPDTIEEGERFAAEDASVFSALWKKLKKGKSQEADSLESSSASS